jgi:hypothetical protein
MVAELDVETATTLEITGGVVSAGGGVVEYATLRLGSSAGRALDWRERNLDCMLAPSSTESLTIHPSLAIPLTQDCTSAVTGQDIHAGLTGVTALAVDDATIVGMVAQFTVASTQLDVARCRS